MFGPTARQRVSCASRIEDRAESRLTDLPNNPETANHSRALRWLTSRFDRHIAGKPPTAVDLVVLDDLLAELERLGASELLEKCRIARDHALRGQDPAAGEKVPWGSLANQQFHKGRYQLGRFRRPFAALRPETYDGMIDRLHGLRRVMATLPTRKVWSENIAVIDKQLAIDEACVRDLRAARASLDDRKMVEVLGEALDDLERAWRDETHVKPSLIDLDVASAMLDRIDDVRRQLERLPPSSTLERARDLEDLWVSAYASFLPAHASAPDMRLCEASTVRRDVPVHADVERLAAIAFHAIDEAGRLASIQMLRGGELLLLPHAIVVLATLGPRSRASHFAERHVFRWLAWRNASWDYHQELRTEMGREGGPRPIYLFVRIPTEATYFNAGRVTMLANRDRWGSPGLWIELELDDRIPIDAWRRFGGPPRLVTIHKQEHTFQRNAELFARWFPVGIKHIEVVTEEGEKLTLHSAGDRVELEYRESRLADPRYCIDEAVPPDAPDVDIVCKCGYTQVRPARETIPYSQATEALTRFIAIDARPAGLARRRPLPPTSNKWLARYRAGEHREVWREIHLLGRRVRQEQHIRNAREVLHDMMLRVRSNIDRIIERLHGSGYEFAWPQEMRVPLTDVERSNLERNDDPPFLPLSLRMFIDVVGRVNLNQSTKQISHADVHGKEWSDDLRLLGREGPLEVCALLTDDVRPSQESGPHAFCSDEAAKGDYSGDCDYVVLPNVNPDFRIQNCGGVDGEWFIDYLRKTVMNGGFRGHWTGSGDEAGHENISKAFRYFLARDLEPF